MSDNIQHTPAIFCRCPDNCIHKSDCAVHNEPAEEAGHCTCLTPSEKRALPGNHYSDGRRWSHISNAWIFEESWNDREEAASLRSKNAALRSQLAEARDVLAKADQQLSGIQQYSSCKTARGEAALIRQDISALLAKLPEGR